MKRREFIGILGGATAATAAWPLATHAQQPIPVIGYLQSGSEENSSDAVAFRRGLTEAGFSDGQNVKIEFRWARQHYDQLPKLAADLVRERVAVIYTIGGVAPAMAAKHATATIPIVFTHGSDPVRTGLVASLNRPGGNVTGINMFTGTLTAKRLELLHALVPNSSEIAALANPKSATDEARLLDAEKAAQALGLRIHPVNVSSSDQFEAAFAELDRQRATALFVVADPLFRTFRGKIIALAARHRIPAIYNSRDYVVGGGLISYGTNFAEVVRQAGLYVGRILKGEKPADLPVLQPTKFDLIINLKTAKALSLEIPPKLLALADEVIE